MKFLPVLFCGVMIFSSSAHAQSLPVFYLDGERAQQQLHLQAAKREEAGKEIKIERYEPELPQIQFYDLEPPKTLQTRIESLIHGIGLSLPPEYDYYGYEIRRYMATVGNDAVFSDSDKLSEAIMAIRRAKLVLEKWKGVLNTRIKALQDEVEQTNSGSPERINFKFKRAEAQKFLNDCDQWITANEEMLLILAKNFKRYRYIAPVFDFRDADTLAAFIEAHATRDEALTAIHEYTPFRLMIY
ncbi:MAG: hypothetical protein ACRBCT_04780 [Alphaproteobacteria bacterium]